MALTNVERFWPKVDVVRDEDSCWLWNAGKNNKGYGAFGYRDEVTGESKVLGAHCFSYLLHFGPLDGLWVLHKCDVPSCVRPSHLFLGTPSENEQDKHAKGRTPTGWKQKSKFCPNGHERIPENQFVKMTKKHGAVTECRICQRERDRARRPPKSPLRKPEIAGRKPDAATR